MGKVVKGVALAAVAVAVPYLGVTLGLFAGSAALLATVNALALGFVVSGISAQLAGMRRVPRQPIAIEYAGTVEPRRIIYGQLRVGGMHTIPAWSSGSDNKYTHKVLTLAGHEVEDITDVYFDTTAIADADIGSITGASTDGVVGGAGAFAARAWIRRYLGTSGQTADYILDTAFSDWTSNHRGRGVAYVALQLEYKESVYRNEPSVSCVVKGKKCYDPRLDTSPGANPTNATYFAWTVNPALCLADYLVDANLGLGEDPSRIDWDMVETAADICDELVDVPTASTQKRYTCNVAIYASSDPRVWQDNITTLAGAMLGSCLYSGGSWKIRAGSWEAASYEVLDSSLVDGGIDVTTSLSYQERYNGIRGTFIDPNNNYQPTEFPAVQDASYVTADGESVFRDVAFQACTNVYEAQRNAIMLVRKSRNKQSSVKACGMQAWKIRPGETGIATISELGWVSKTERCEGWKFNPAGYVELTAREELASDWDDPVEGDYLTPTSISTPVPVYFTPAAPSALATTSVPRGIVLSWTAPTLVPASAKYAVYEYTSSTPFASATKVWEGLTTTIRLDKTDTTTRYYWVRLEMPEGTMGVEYPTSTSGVSGAARLVDTDDVETGAATVTYTDYDATVSASSSHIAVLDVSISEAGTFEITFSGIITVSSFSGAGWVEVSATNTGAGSFVGSNFLNYRVTALNQVIEFTVSKTFETSGAGSWAIQANVDEVSGGNQYELDNIELRVTVIRR